MKRLFILALMALFSAELSAQSFFDTFKARKVSDHVWVIHGPLQQPNPQNRGFMNNPAFIVADSGVIVVDPGSSDETGQLVLDRIQKVTDLPVTHVINTHVHGDHWLGNNQIKQAYPKALIIADPRMIKKAKAGEGQSWIDLLDRLTEGATRGTELEFPSKAVTDGDRFKIHNLDFRIHSVGKGHSDSDIMIELVNDSLMFTGDNVAYQRIIRLDDGSFRDNIAACDRAIELNLKHYVPGHGPTGDVSIIQAQKDYLVVLYEKVTELYEEGLSDFEMKPQVVEALAMFSDWSGFEHEVGKHISLAILEVEQAAFE